MLKNVPRLITVFLLLFFLLPICGQQFAYFLKEESGAVRDPEGARNYNRAAEIVSGYFSPANWLELVDYDLHVGSRNAGKMSPNVALVEVGEKSLRDIGQFPFSRSIYRTLIDRLQRAGAKVVAFDIMFPEQDARIDMVGSLLQLQHEVKQREGFDSLTARQIQEKINELDADEDFANALHDSALPIVLGFTFAKDLTKRSAEAERHLELVKQQLRDYKVTLLRGEEVSENSVTSFLDYVPVSSIPKLVGALNKKGSVGHINPAIDRDGTIRAIPAVVGYEGDLYASLAVRALAAYFGEDAIVIKRQPSLAVRGTSLYVPVDGDGRFRLTFYGKGHTFPYTEFSEVVGDRAGGGKLSDDELKKRFEGKIVFLGVTAIGLKDLRAAAGDMTYPGVETHATMASNVLNGTFLIRDHRFFLFGYLFTLCFGLLVSWVVFRLHPVFSFTVTLLSVALIQAVAHYVLFDNGIVAPTILPSLCCLLMFFTGVLFRYFTEEREKKVVRAAFSRYVSGAVVEEILKDQTKLRLGGQKKELTVMFVDLVSFTKVTEHMDAGFVTQLLNEYFTRLTNILLHNHGTLDKYMGDSIMCFWGAPLENPDHARLACQTALEIRAETDRIAREWKLKHGILVDNRVGIHTGVMAVGNMGSDQVFSYTVMGDNVNLGSRLEGVNTAYGTSVIVSAETAARAGSGFLFRPLDRVQVKGKEDSVDILELVSLKPEKEPEWVHAFRSGLKHYQAGEWDDAEAAFGACLTLKPGDGPSQVFIERIRDFRIVAPDDWHGVWKLSSK